MNKKIILGYSVIAIFLAGFAVLFNYYAYILQGLLLGISALILPRVKYLKKEPPRLAFAYILLLPVWYLTILPAEIVLVLFTDNDAIAALLGLYSLFLSLAYSIPLYNRNKSYIKNLMRNRIISFLQKLSPKSSTEFLGLKVFLAYMILIILSGVGLLVTFLDGSYGYFFLFTYSAIPFTFLFVKKYDQNILPIILYGPAATLGYSIFDLIYHLFEFQKVILLLTVFIPLSLIPVLLGNYIYNYIYKKSRAPKPEAVKQSTLKPNTMGENSGLQNNFTKYRSSYLNFYYISTFIYVFPLLIGLILHLSGIRLDTGTPPRQVSPVAGSLFVILLASLLTLPLAPIILRVKHVYIPLWPIMAIYPPLSLAWLVIYFRVYGGESDAFIGLIFLYSFTLCPLVIAVVGQIPKIFRKLNWQKET